MQYQPYLEDELTKVIELLPTAELTAAGRCSKSVSIWIMSN